MKMKVVCSLEKSVNFYLTTRRYFPEDNIPRSDRSEILKSKMCRLKPCGFILHIFCVTRLIQVQSRFVGV
jgi:hypothetical protein